MAGRVEQDYGGHLPSTLLDLAGNVVSEVAAGGVPKERIRLDGSAVLNEICILPNAVFAFDECETIESAWSQRLREFAIAETIRRGWRKRKHRALFGTAVHEHHPVIPSSDAKMRGVQEVLSQGSQRRCVEDNIDRQFRLHPLFHERNHLHGSEAVSAEVEEILIPPDVAAIQDF